MQLKLARTQNAGMTGKVTFRLHAIALLTDKEADAVKRYKLHKEVIWSKNKVDPLSGNSVLGVVGKLAAAAVLNIRLTIGDLAEGRIFECKDVTEMLAVEEQLRQACEVLVSVLQAAAHFGGEELIEI